MSCATRDGIVVVDGRLDALNSTARRYCLMLRIFVVFSRIQSMTNSMWLLFSFKNLLLTNSAG